MINLTFSTYIWLIWSISIFVAVTSLFLTDVLPIAYALVLILCILVFLKEKTIFFVYPILMFLFLVFVSPLIYYDLPIANKKFLTAYKYDHDLIAVSIIFIIIFLGQFINERVFVDKKRNNMPKSDILAIIFSIVLIYFSFLMIQDGTVIDYKYGNIDEERITYIEYASIISLLGLMTVKTKKIRRVLYFSIVVYLIATLLDGLRLRFLSVSIVLFCVVYGLNTKSIWKFYALVAIISMSMIGFTRMGVEIHYTGLGDTMTRYFMRDGAIVSTFGGSYQTGEFFNYAISQESGLKIFNGLKYFLGDILSIIMTKSGVPESINFKSNVFKNYDVPGGGWIVSYYYAYFGVIGAIVLSVFVTYIYNKIINMKGTIGYASNVLLAAYAPRFLFYDWTVVFKMMFFFSVIVIIMNLISKRNFNQMESI